MSLGCSVPGSVASFNDRLFFYHDTGFYMCISGTTPVPIGLERVNTYFAARMSPGGRDYVFSGIYPQKSAYVIGFNSDGMDGYPITECLCYFWNMGQAGEWTHLIDGGSYECLFNGVASDNTTLEDLDIYGTLEDVPFSLDSPVWLGTGSELFGAFDSDHNSGWFNGGNMNARVTTTEAELIDGRHSMVRGYNVLVSGAALSDIQGTVLSRDTLAADAATNAASQDKTPNARGLIRARIKGAYHRAQIDVTGDDWTKIVGISGLEYHDMGVR